MGAQYDVFEKFKSKLLLETVLKHLFPFFNESSSFLDNFHSNYFQKLKKLFENSTQIRIVSKTPETRPKYDPKNSALKREKNIIISTLLQQKTSFP